ncbi:MAG: alpha/beta hydrolase [Deltaproteobacteria bacterium]|nr:alpha/beta hydrolase [Deltaproteobacteria bacterium]
MLRLVAAAGIPSVETLSAADARKVFAASAGLLAGRAPVMSRVENRCIAGPAGQIALRIYVPRTGKAPHPVLVYYHGGGWVIGSPDTHDVPARCLAERSACIVISVDYRLAPEHKFPGPFEDAMASFAWAAANAASFGGDPSRIAVGGDSAGGNLAAAVAQQTSLTGRRVPDFQLLVYPVTDLGAESRSYELFADGFYLTRPLMRWFRDHYLPDSTPASAWGEDPRVSPLRAPNLAGLPPACVMTAGFDPLRNEGKAYAERLLEAGVAVDYRNYPTLIHGFLSMAGVIGPARSAFADAVSALRAGLRTG